MKDAKLVLVLDLDNTLLHTTEFIPVTSTNPNGGGGGKHVFHCAKDCKFVQAFLHKHPIGSGMHLFDPHKRIYHVWEGTRCSFLVKLRPFCGEFLRIAMSDFEVHFNTAAAKSYA